MPDELANVNERVVDLAGRSAGESSAKLVELATTLGYSIAATAPGSYRLARTRRRMLIVKHVESVTITISEDRSGTRARIVGTVDSALIEHLVVTTTHLTPARPAILDAHSAASPVAPLPTTPSAGPSRPSPPTPSPGGMITTPSWARQLEPPTLSGLRQADVFAAPVTSSDDVSDEPDARTVARSSIRREQASGPSIGLPDGRVVPLTSPIVIGRGPDPSRGPSGAVALAVADPSLSKTHAVFEVDSTGIWVTDLHSTNGTALEGVGSAIPCAPGARTRLPTGAVVRFGDVVVTTQGVA